MTILIISFLIFAIITMVYHTPIFLYNASWADLFALLDDRIDLTSTNVVNFFERVGYPIQQDINTFVGEKIIYAILTIIALAILLTIIAIFLIKINKCLNKRNSQNQPTKKIIN